MQKERLQECYGVAGKAVQRSLDNLTSNLALDYLPQKTRAYFEETKRQLEQILGRIKTLQESDEPMKLSLFIQGFRLSCRTRYCTFLIHRAHRIRPRQTQTKRGKAGAK